MYKRKRYDDNEQARNVYFSVATRRETHTNKRQASKKHNPLTRRQCGENAMAATRRSIIMLLKLQDSRLL